MATRREIIGTIAAIPVLSFQPTISWPQSTAVTPDGPVGVPELLGEADFAQAWELAPGSIAVPVAAVPDLPAGSAGALSKMLSTATEADALFGSSGFIKWFNSKLANKSVWAGKSIVGSQDDFDGFWNSFLTIRKLTAMEFIAYMSIFINEVGGQMANRSERYGRPPLHPGVSYLFDRVQITSGPRTYYKKSYNKAASLNRSAGSLFVDPLFMQAHSGAPLSGLLSGSSDPVWKTDKFPLGQYPHDGKYSTSGFILECDFFKFRGRGLLQTTWRANYLNIASYIHAYEGKDGLLNEYKAKWLPYSPDEICTVSTLTDWEDLFSAPSKHILSAAVVIHNSTNGNYASLGTNDIALNGSSKGSLHFMGKSVGGNDSYGSLLKSRARSIVRTLLT